jgi:branched-chain amino acid transport system permease protein
MDGMKRFQLTPERRVAIVGGAIAIGFMSFAVWGDARTMNAFTEFFYLLALGQLWNLLAGYAGLVSVGQQAWIGIGGYAMLILADDFNVPLILAVVLAGVAAALLSYPAAKLLFRLRGGYFAIGTWVVSEVFYLLLAGSTRWSGGGLGRSLQAARVIQPPAMRITIVYVLAVIIAIGSVVLVYYLMRSRLGLGLTAIRDSESGAANLGVNVGSLKLFVYVVCAAGTAIVGALIYLNALNIVPKAAFSVNWTAYMIFIVVIGGIGTVEGPIIGTIVFFLIRQFLSDFGEWSFIILGSIAVTTMLLAPKGIWGLIRGRFQAELFPIRRRLPEALMRKSEK